MHVSLAVQTPLSSSELISSGCIAVSGLIVIKGFTIASSGEFQSAYLFLHSKRRTDKWCCVVCVLLFAECE